MASRSLQHSILCKWSTQDALEPSLKKMLNYIFMSLLSHDIFFTNINLPHTILFTGPVLIYYLHSSWSEIVQRWKWQWFLMHIIFLCERFLFQTDCVYLGGQHIASRLDFEVHQTDFKTIYNYILHFTNMTSSGLYSFDPLRSSNSSHSFGLSAHGVCPGVRRPRMTI